MKRIVALVGVRGAGKSTLFNALGKCQSVFVLKPTTNRPKRSSEEEEYEFVHEFPHGNAMAWKIKVGDYFYGVRNEKVKDIPDGWCGVTVFDPGSIQELTDFRQSWSGEVVTIGIDTIATVGDQHARVGSDETRQMTASDFDTQLETVRNSDIVLCGNAVTVLDAAKAVCELLVSRGGIVTKNWLVPLIKAGTLLYDARVEAVQPASYDLRLGSEVWCQGKRHQLTEKNPFFKIPPYSYAIVKAQESARIPCVIAGRFDLTVSLFFKGVLLSNGPQVDPGYNGALFCTLFNGRDVHADLKMDQHFATLEFCVLGTRVDGYAGQHQNKNDLNAFLEAETGAGPGGNIVGRIEKLEKVSWERWAIGIAGIAGIVALPSVVQLWTIDEFKERANTTLERIEASAERDVQTIVKDLPEKTKEARASLSEEAMRIERVRAEVDEMNQRVKLLEKELKRLEEYEARPSNAADVVLPSTNSDR